MEMSTLCIQHRSISDVEIGTSWYHFLDCLEQFRSFDVLQVVTGDKQLGYQWTIAFLEGNWFPEFATSSL